MNRLESARNWTEPGVVYKRLRELLSQEETSKQKFILDFGAGYCNNKQWIEDLGHKYIAFDLNPRMDFVYKDFDALLNIMRGVKAFEYTVVSNVINVQETLSQLEQVLRQLKQLRSAKTLINYPKEPRYLNLDNFQMSDIVKKELWNQYELIF